jgi:hypothetical protein
MDKIGSAIPAINAGFVQKKYFYKCTYLKNVKRKDSFKIT